MRDMYNKEERRLNRNEIEKHTHASTSIPSSNYFTNKLGNCHSRHPNYKYCLVDNFTTEIF